jgi:hypothetical protein
LSSEIGKKERERKKIEKPRVEKEGEDKREGGIWNGKRKTATQEILLRPFSLLLDIQTEIDVRDNILL